MRVRLRRAGLAAATAAGTVLRVAARVAPGVTGVLLASVGVGMWSGEPGAGLTVAGVLLLADRIAIALRQGEPG